MNALTINFNLTIWGVFGTLLGLGRTETSLTDARLRVIFPILIDEAADRFNINDFEGQTLINDVVEALSHAEEVGFGPFINRIIRKSVSDARDYLHMHSREGFVRRL